jgi:hypothetical protein
MRAVVALVLSLLVPALAEASACRAQSGTHVLPLVELYTSEGCDSCPPADRWLSEQFPAGRTTGAIALAFHVDYWDRLGWKDRFASPAFTDRQYAVAKSRTNAPVYTPQVLVQGQPIERWRGRDAAEAIRTARARDAQASIEIIASVQDSRVSVDIRTSLVRAIARRDAALFVGYADSGLVSQVVAGENRGARLTHDHVVRELQSAMLYSDGATEASFSFRRPAEAGIAPKIVAFVQNRATGDVLQSVALPIDDCR